MMGNDLEATPVVLRMTKVKETAGLVVVLVVVQAVAKGLEGSRIRLVMTEIA